MPDTSKFPNQIDIPVDILQLESEIKGQESKQHVDGRYALPSNDLLNAIHDIARKIIHPLCHGTLAPELLVGIGILVQELIWEEKAPSSLDLNDMLERTPSILDVLGSEMDNYSTQSFHPPKGGIGEERQWAYVSNPA